MRLLLLEDDVLLGDSLREFLRAEGHGVDWCQNLHQALALRGEPFDALLVDWQLPDGSGLDWLRAQRARGDKTPALMLTARDRLNQRIEGLDSGADDYLVKPFAPEELAARLRALGRRMAGGGAALRRLQAAGSGTGTGAGAGAGTGAGAGEDSDVAVDLTARAALLRGQSVPLTAREWAVLEALVLRAGRIVTKDELERLVLGFESELASNALEVHVSALRRKLGREVIETVRGLGYRVHLL
jgi:two-component system OmpR family response regulator